MKRVIKIGGSLASNGALGQCLEKIAAQSRPDTLVVPGGGMFAEQVRQAQKQWQFDDEAAHQMAILAMQQVALLYKSLQADWQIVSSWADLYTHSESIRIWSPDIAELNKEDIPATWGMTSDSLAAWLAGKINAKELIVLKSIEIGTEHNISAMQRAGIVDLEFHHFIQNALFKTTVTHHQTFFNHQADGLLTELLE